VEAFSGRVDIVEPDAVRDAVRDGVRETALDAAREVLPGGVDVDGEVAVTLRAWIPLADQPARLIAVAPVADAGQAHRP
jgi:hypothetical protein